MVLTSTHLLQFFSAVSVLEGLNSCHVLALLNESGSCGAGCLLDCSQVGQNNSVKVLYTPKKMRRQNCGLRIKLPLVNSSTPAPNADHYL